MSRRIPLHRLYQSMADWQLAAKLVVLYSLSRQISHVAFDAITLNEICIVDDGLLWNISYQSVLYAFNNLVLGSIQDGAVH